MDLTASIVPKSDQLNADDLIANPITVTIKDVSPGNPEQPVNVNLVEFPGRAYRPSKSMRRVMVRAWGPETSTYAGHQLTLYRNPEIMFGGQKVGGIEISHMSDIDGPKTIALTRTRGKRTDFTVQPLSAASHDSSAPADSVVADEWISVIEAASTTPQLEAAWGGAVSADVARDARVIAAKDKRKKELA